MKMNKLHPNEYHFFPKTWVLPNDYSEFLKYQKANEGQTFIVKPDCSSQGKGIILTKSKDGINPKSNFVIQEYIENPFLVDNLKFDIRLYVMVTSVDPLRIYLYNEGMVRFATVEYVPPNDENINNEYIHLTNYAINKNNSNFQFNEESTDKGHKRTLKAFWETLKSSGIEVDLIQKEIKDIIIKTFLWVQPQLAHEYKSWVAEDTDGSSWFEILGFDIMLDENLDPLLLEVNHAPSFATESNLDLNLKTKLLQDSFRLLDINLKKKIKYKKDRNKIIQNRVFPGKREILSFEEKDVYKKYSNFERHKFETNNLGDYELLFPIVDSRGSLIGDHTKDYNIDVKEVKPAVNKSSPIEVTASWVQDTDANTQNSVISKDFVPKELVPRFSLPNIENSFSPKLVRQMAASPMIASTPEKLTIKYQRFMKDAFDEWEDFTSGYRIKSKYLLYDDVEPSK